VPAPPAVFAVAWRLRVDAWTAEVVRAMRGEGVRPILLKGPATARWLYPDDAERRTYRDTDLLVSPADTASARRVLVELGFEPLSHPRLEPDEQHARPYRRARDGATVDLHRTIHGLQAVPIQRAWEAITTDTDSLTVGGVDVEIPSLTVRLLHLALHLAPCDDVDSQAWRDLERGLERATLDDWRRAAELAAELRVGRELSHRLRTIPRGAVVAEALGLTRRGSRYFLVIGGLQRGVVPDDLLALAVLSALPDRSSRLRYVRGKLWPPAEILRARFALARHGRWGLGLVRTAHILGALRRAPAALAAWRRCGRDARAPRRARSQRDEV
jgi:hypothetical protein